MYYIIKAANIYVLFENMKLFLSKKQKYTKFYKFAANIFAMKKNPLLKYKNIPVLSNILTADFANLLSPEEKIRALEKDGQLIRLKRGLYVVSEDVCGKKLIRVYVQTIFTDRRMFHKNGL